MKRKIFISLSCTAASRLASRVTYNAAVTLAHKTPLLISHFSLLLLYSKRAFWLLLRCTFFCIQTHRATCVDYFIFTAVKEGDGKIQIDFVGRDDANCSRAE